MAANYRHYNNKQVTLIPISPRIREANPLIAVVEDFADKHVPMTLFEAKVHNEDAGAPAVHPRMMLKVLFYAYAQGIRSSRMVSKLMDTDPHYIYLSGNESVEHTTISLFLTRYGEEIVELFKGMVYALEESGYIGGKDIVIDGSKIRASAGKRFTGTVEDFRRKEERISRALKEWVAGCRSDAGDADMDKRRRVLEGNRERIGRFLSRLEGEKGLRNMTDMDCRAVRDGEGKVIMGYNGQVGVDGKHHLVVGAEVFNEASDSVLLEPMLDKVEGVGKSESTRVLADAGYFSGANVKRASERGIDVWMPETGAGRKTPGNRIDARSCDLELDGDKRRLRCPGGQVMETDRARLKWRKGDRDQMYYYFRSDVIRCEGCSLYERCYGGLRAGRAKVFTVKREYFDSLLERKEMQAKLSSPEGKGCMRRRGSIVEHVFGSIKEHLGLRRFSLRGLRKVRIQWLLCCMGYNFGIWARLKYG